MCEEQNEEVVVNLFKEKMSSTRGWGPPQCGVGTTGNASCVVGVREREEQRRMGREKAVF